MNATEFFLKYNNKFLDVDNAYGNQCADLIKAYFPEVLGIPPIMGNASGYWRDIPGFKKIPYKPGTQPNPGDIMIWSIKPFGHIGICNWSRVQDFNAFEQNWPIGSPCHFQDHNYGNVLGWLRPLNQPETPRPVPKPPKGPWKFPLTIVGADIPGLASEVLKWSKGDFILEIKNVPKDLPYDPTVDYSKYVQDRFCIVSCNPGPEIYKTTLTNDLQHAYTVGGTSALACAFEVSHLAHKYYLAHRGTNPYIDIPDTLNPSDEQRYLKYDIMKPYMGVILG